MPKFEVIIDNHLCWGCKTCEVACKQENHAAYGIKLISVVEKCGHIADQQQSFVFHVNLCRHCDEPPCVAACPEEAIRQRGDGLVIMDYELCTGCRACIDECTYDAIVFDEDRSIAQKCNLCHHRIDQGLIPACADNICLAHCIHFKSASA